MNNDEEWVDEYEDEPVGFTLVKFDGREYRDLDGGLNTWDGLGWIPYEDGLWPLELELGDVIITRKPFQNPSYYCVGYGGCIIPGAEEETPRFQAPVESVRRSDVEALCLDRRVQRR